MLRIYSLPFLSLQQIQQREQTEKLNLLLSCPQYKLWPRQPLQQVASLIEWVSYKPNTGTVYRMDLLQTKHRYGLQTGSPTNQTQVRSTDWISYKPNTGMVYRLDLLQTRHRYGLQTGCPTNQTQVYLQSGSPTNQRQVRSTDWISYNPNIVQTKDRYGLQTGFSTNQTQV